MTVNERPPRHHIIDVRVPVDILEIRAARPRDEQRTRADGLERAHRAVHAAGQDPRGRCEELFRPCISGPFTPQHRSMKITPFEGSFMRSVIVAACVLGLAGLAEAQEKPVPAAPTMASTI